MNRRIHMAVPIALLLLAQWPAQICTSMTGRGPAPVQSHWQGQAGAAQAAAGANGNGAVDKSVYMDPSRSVDERVAA